MTIFLYLVVTTTVSFFSLFPNNSLNSQSYFLEVEVLNMWWYLKKQGLRGYRIWHWEKVLKQETN